MAEKPKSKNQQHQTNATKHSSRAQLVPVRSSGRWRSAPSPPANQLPRARPRFSIDLPVIHAGRS